MQPRQPLQTDVLLDGDKLIDSLANQNEPPEIRGNVPHQWALFTVDFDWNEQQRVRKQIQSCIDNIDQAWPLLAASFKDERYCITIRGNQSSRNLSIGSVCYIIMAESVQSAHASCLRKNNVVLKKSNHWNVMPHGKDEFAQYLKNQKASERELYRIQIEMCEKVLSELPDVGKLSEKVRNDTARCINETIHTLRDGKKSISMGKFFIRESRGIYTKLDADELREEHMNDQMK